MPGNQWCDCGPKMQIDTWFRFSQIIKGCVFDHRVDTSYRGLPIYLLCDLNAPLEKSLPTFLPLGLWQPDRQGPGSGSLWDFLVSLHCLISMHPKKPDTTGLSGHYLWIILLIDCQLCHAISASMCMRVSGGSASASLIISVFRAERIGRKPRR